MHFDSRFGGTLVTVATSSPGLVRIPLRGVLDVDLCLAIAVASSSMSRIQVEAPYAPGFHVIVITVDRSADRGRISAMI